MTFLLLPVVFGTTLSLWALKVLVSGHTGIVRHGFPLCVVDLKLPQSLIGNFHKFCTTIAPAYVAGMAGFR